MRRLFVSVLQALAFFTLVSTRTASAGETVAATAYQAKDAKVTILSTMMTDVEGVGASAGICQYWLPIASSPLLATDILGFCQRQFDLLPINGCYSPTGLLGNRIFAFNPSKGLG